MTTNTHSTFLDAAGGVRQSSYDYGDRRASRDKSTFWSYWQEGDHADVVSVYVSNADIERLGRDSDALRQLLAGSLRDFNNHSIEHVLPKNWTRQVLRHNSTLKNGAETNPLNWLPCADLVNGARDNLMFDTEGDTATRTRILNVDTRKDSEGEWIVPGVNKGEVARAVLYMAVVYGMFAERDDTSDQLFLIDVAESSALREWSQGDPPKQWEVDYNTFVKAKFNISNPLITEPGRWEQDEPFWNAEHRGTGTGSRL